MQEEILQSNPHEPISVYAVWFNQLPGDSRGAWNPDLLDDPRVNEYWDSDTNLGSWMAEHRDDIGFDNPGPVVWDASLLFGPDAEWAEVPGPLAHFGRTVIADSDDLEEQLQSIWDVAP